MSEHLRRTKIVATLGPASQSPEILARMMDAGMDVARINLSHGTAEEHKARVAALREASRRTEERRVGLLFDLRGPEIRLGTFAGGEVNLVAGRAFAITTDAVVGGEERVSVEYPGLPGLCRPGDSLLLDDGNLALEVTRVTPREVACVVRTGGVLGDRKKVNLPGRRLDVPYLTPKDEADLEMAVALEADFIAASFTRRAADLLAVRGFLAARGGRQMVIAKIESQEALENLDEIIAAADGLMVARGDLGVEVPEEDVPILQKSLIARAVAVGKPVITATQMLESMASRPRPTRAEASDVANAIFDGTDAVMLSAESASGRYPVEAVQTMARIVERAERALGLGPDRAVEATWRPRPWWAGRGVPWAAAQPDTAVGPAPAATGPKAAPGAPLHGVTEAISLATVTVADELRAGAIVTATVSGFTARMVARHRPAAPIIAVTSGETVARQLTLSWGVTPVRSGEASSTDEMFLRATVAAWQSGLVEPGSVIVITAGAPPGTIGTTNLIKVHTLGRVLARGKGLLPASATGRARVCGSARAALAGVGEGDVLVARALDRAWFEPMLKAAGWVVEETGERSFAAVQARALGRVVIIGAAGALRSIPDGETVTLDGARGLVYEGKATVL